MECSYPKAYRASMHYKNTIELIDLYYEVQSAMQVSGFRLNSGSNWLDCGQLSDTILTTQEANLETVRKVQAEHNKGKNEDLTTSDQIHQNPVHYTDQ